MTRSLVTIDLPAVRHNVATLRAAIGDSRLWAVVKADAYGHGAADISRAALVGGAEVLCVATVTEGAELRGAIAEARILVLTPGLDPDLRLARETRLELCWGGAGAVPAGLPIHVELETGMGRWGVSEWPSHSPDVVGVMTHFATADTDSGFARKQLDRFLSAVGDRPDLERHAANSAAALTFPESRLDAVRCGVALYGIDPFGGDPSRFGLRPVLRWDSELARVKLLERGESAGYGRLFVATEPTWIGIVPVGYADGFVRALTGTEVLVGGERCSVVGAVSMDALAVRLPGEQPVGTNVTLVGDGVTLEDHARVAGTIAYELATGVRVEATRTGRQVLP
jgi:alanine racemase